MAETGSAGGLEKAPAGLRNLTAVVTLSSGEAITIHKWSVTKARQMAQFAGDDAKLSYIAEQSVAEGDRARVRELPEEDQVAIAAAAVDLNRRLLKNLLTLGQAWSEALPGGEEKTSR